MFAGRTPFHIWYSFCSVIQSTFNHWIEAQSEHWTIHFTKVSQPTNGNNENAWPALTVIVSIFCSTCLRELRNNNTPLECPWPRVVSGFLSSRFRPKRRRLQNTQSLITHTQNWPTYIQSSRHRVWNSRRYAPVAGLFWQPWWPVMAAYDDV